MNSDFYKGLIIGVLLGLAPLVIWIIIFWEANQ